jgi:hypothetical protein
MFYLVTESQKGYKLIGLSDRQLDLTAQIPALLDKNPASSPVVYDDKALRAGFLVDGFGIVAQEGDGYLVPLDDL